ncbi:sensor histidine kinase KdpD [Reichenbachiella sp. MSK19-1]|uniref:sensor histidine kinase n=1 Tax=Reichenbachiella sp. MSK19-1 TaxID=1897631 RepID=UPI000E6C2BAF|nr:HAMP domain-containing sensor histidine kinase [Reichenbachiella sp. MSK19-1]RJE75449.1 histidine kinase [Reichenbachiella sp. MSK19-1]
MKIESAIDFFIHPVHFENPNVLRRARLFVRACLLTSFFSSSYIWMSVIFGYERGVYLMLFNVIGFLLLPLYAKTKVSIVLLGNVYVLIGAVAIVILTYYSGGVWSAIYPWIISIPVLALLVVNKSSGIIWGAISFLAMLWFGYKAYIGVELPVEYNPELRVVWYISVLPGLLLIVLFIAFVFESIQAKALGVLERNNKELKEQKETILLQSIELEKVVGEKDNIIRVLAHDLKSPLSNIQSLAKFINQDIDLEQKKLFVQLIERSSVNAQNLVNRVLEMDAAGQSDLNIQLVPVNTVSIIRNIIQPIKEGAKAKNIVLLFEDHTENALCDLDEIYLTLILENLISNAIKFSPENKKIQVVSTNEDNMLVISVIDEGPGIVEEDVNMLFKKFTKLRSRPTAGESSAGLGLSLVKRYVEMMGGRVWYEDAKTGGANFRVAFQLSPSKVID